MPSLSSSRGSIRPEKEAVEDFITRGHQGWCRRDLWSFNTYLAGVIAGGLREFADNLNGVNEEYIQEGETLEQACERWADVLRGIAEQFAAYKARDDLSETPEFDDAWLLLREHWRHLWD